MSEKPNDILLLDYTKHGPRDDLEPGWYIAMPSDEGGMLLTGPFDSKEKALDGLKAIVIKATALSLGLQLDEETKK